jgi:hypothetical protein
MKPAYVHEKLVTMCELNNVKILTTLLQYYAARWLADANTKCQVWLCLMKTGNY